MALPQLLMANPAHYEVAYAINPWMRPELWAVDREGNQHAARQAWLRLRSSLELAGAEVIEVPAVPGVPDLVFPANSAVILDGRALVGRFRHPERRMETPIFVSALEELVERGLLHETHQLPEGLHQEGAGDCVWDPTRQLFWAGFGPRSSAGAAEYAADFFGVPVVLLELIAPHYYHMDVCLMPFEGGEIVYYPAAFSEAALGELRSRVPPHLLIEAAPEEAGTLAINAVNFGRRVIMAAGAPRLTAELRDRGYEPAPVNLEPFVRSGGASFCMTLRLDQRQAQSK